MKFILALVLVTACTGPEEVLKVKGRPEPITCVTTASYQETCSDGEGVIWTCYTGNTTASCIATGRVPGEVSK